MSLQKCFRWKVVVVCVTLQFQLCYQAVMRKNLSVIILLVYDLFIYWRRRDKELKSKSGPLFSPEIPATTCGSADSNILLLGVAQLTSSRYEVLKAKQERNPQKPKKPLICVIVFNEATQFVSLQPYKFCQLSKEKQFV